MQYGLIGEHLGHSFSKQIHESVAHYSYDLLELAPSEVASFLKKREFQAINVTIPYKQVVIPYLDHISDEAKSIGAVNTVVNRSGVLFGYNTDYYGFIGLVKHSGIEVKGKTVLILGTGGASKAVEVALKNLGAKEVLKASIVEGEGISYDEIYDHQDVRVIVNATPVGMYPHNEDSIVDISRFTNLEGYLDVIYNPLRTLNVIKVQEMGLKAEGGLYMLVAQAIYAMEYFLDKKIDESVIEKTYQDILKKNRNIVLIGMPSSGKTMVAKALKEYEIVDTDELVVQKIGIPIKEYFAKYGEKAFRDVETEVISEIYKNAPRVIATGGGVILKEENIKMLKQNGILIFLNRDLDKLVATSDRPLSSNLDDLRKLFDYRYPLYKKYADVVVNDNQDIEKVIEEVRRFAL